MREPQGLIIHRRRPEAFRPQAVSRDERNLIQMSYYNTQMILFPPEALREGEHIRNVPYSTEIS
jgi:hypothetical protein